MRGVFSKTRFHSRLSLRGQYRFRLNAARRGGISSPDGSRAHFGRPCRNTARSTCGVSLRGGLALLLPFSAGPLQQCILPFCRDRVKGKYTAPPCPDRRAGRHRSRNSASFQMTEIVRRGAHRAPETPVYRHAAYARTAGRTLCAPTQKTRFGDCPAVTPPPREAGLRDCPRAGRVGLLRAHNVRPYEITWGRGQYCSSAALPSSLPFSMDRTSAV